MARVIVSIVRAPLTSVGYSPVPEVGTVATSYFTVGSNEEDPYWFTTWPEEKGLFYAITPFGLTENEALVVRVGTEAPPEDSPSADLDSDLQPTMLLLNGVERYFIAKKDRMLAFHTLDMTIGA